jgi:hypothetical protein
MNAPYPIDHAKCPTGHLTPLQTSTPQSAAEYQRQIATGGDPILVACVQCHRVYRVHEIHSHPSMRGLLPDDPTTPLRVFVEPIECDGEPHTVPLTVWGVRHENTKVADLKMDWKWAEGEDSRCPFGDEIQLPQYIGGSIL